MERKFIGVINFIPFLSAFVVGLFIYFSEISSLENILYSSLSSFLLAFIISNIRYNIKLKKIKSGELSKNLIEIADNSIKKSSKNSFDFDVDNTIFQISTLIHHNYSSLEFMPDSPAIDLLHNKNGIISFTDANPMEWMNPTYYFFLINNLSNSLINRLDFSKKIKSLNYTLNRNSDEFKLFLKSKKDALKKLGGILTKDDLINLFKTNKSSFRFYMLSESEFKRNKKIIELLIAVHEMYGIYLFFLNEDFLKIRSSTKYKPLIHLLEMINDEDTISNDFAVSIDDVINITSRKGNRLSYQKMDNKNIQDFIEFIRALCGDIESKYTDKHDVFYSEELFHGLTANNTYNHIYVEYE